jgi:hypothetical protein
MEQVTHMGCVTMVRCEHCLIPTSHEISDTVLGVRFRCLTCWMVTDAEMPDATLEA